MRVWFPRLPDRMRAYSLVERGDGVRYRVHEGIASAHIPHDLVHFLIERELGEDGGFWGAVAAGAVFDSMEHLSGRRPPQSARRSARAKRERAHRLQRAELLPGVVARVVEEGITEHRRVRAVAAEVLSTIPDPSVPEAEVIAAAGELERTARRWGSLVPGEELVFEWPEPGRR
ncbi:hypothetical protein [Sciscionella marina]|uniref:hypothetical protein n=1 Tax=Sciscionella marina TaxID=508770 RepID=UPI00036E2961|nr:hypothetical protein [Sciscionella marina]